MSSTTREGSNRNVGSRDHPKKGKTPRLSAKTLQKEEKIELAPCRPASLMDVKRSHLKNGKRGPRTKGHVDMSFYVEKKKKE